MTSSTTRRGRPARKSWARRLSDHPAPTPQPTPCRLWQGPVSGSGYGTRPDREAMHRWVWRMAFGEVPDGLFVLHRCDQRLCYRFDHLFLGTNADNVRDMMSKGRQSSPPRGNRTPLKLTDDQVRAIRSAVDAGESQRSVAARFQIGQPTVSKIVRRLAWSHL